MQKIIIHEVGLRDGLQMEKQVVPMEQKLKWINGLMESGVDIIQVGSFVHPEKVPQMADTDKLFTELTKNKTSKVILSGLVLNEKGLERGFNCGVEMFCMGVSASETHSKKNTGMSIVEATERIIAIAKQAEAAGKRVQVSVQSAFGCGYEGFVPQERVLGIIQKYLDAGLKKISLADTAGYATPDQVEKLFEAIFKLDSSVEAACHFHNTYGMGIANTYAAMKVGVQNYESSVAGLGGCPFTKVTAGNVCTEDFVHSLQRMDFRNDINLIMLIEIAKEFAVFFNREMPGLVYKTGPIRVV
ncbi:MAG: hydroxymethylglutaryl-CoA lyase [Bacteroidetes bacterium]|nr:hydroxymethylglutaryl-CoA lyase [Bacteroidota bacterium]MBU1423057.1 hydroxymethylglutaryl-CoA lyase [Bacteroidota bacterium]